MRGPNKHQQRTEQTRRKLLEAGLRIFVRDGFEAARIEDIAAAAGHTRGAFYANFETKEDLTYALIDHILERYLLIYTIKHKDQATLENLQHMVEMLFSKKWNLLFDDGLFYTFYALAFREKKIKVKYKVILDTLRQNLAAIIQECNAKGLTMIEDPKIVADLIFVLVDGAYFYLSLEDDKKAYSERLNYYKQKAYDALAIPQLPASGAIPSPVLPA